MLNLFSDEMRRNPYPLYARMRRETPVLHIPQFNAWLVFDYDGVDRALNDHEAFGSAVPAPSNWFLFSDAPRHTRLRALIARAFTPRSVAVLEQRIRELSRELLDAVVERGEMDLAAEYAVPLPMRVIADLLGIPPGDLDRYKRWSDEILKLSYSLFRDAGVAEAHAAFVNTTEEMRAVLPDWLEERRGAPRDDLLTRLVEAEVDGERLTNDEILGFVQLLLVGGQETTANLINNAVLCLIENPDQLALLRSQPTLLPSAIEEVLRYRSPLQWVMRSPRKDVEMHGQAITAGNLVLAVVGAANHDPARFAEPDAFDITRSPNPHLAFGRGVHFCMGTPLARLEARIALTDLLERLPEFALASDAPWEPRQALHVHGPARLPISFRSAQRASHRGK
jgi:cytochrome P450